MITAYLNRCRAALVLAKQVELPRIGGLVAVLCLSLLVYIGIAILDGPVGKREYHFVAEPGLIAGLSAVMLAMAGGFAGAAGFLAAKGFDRRRLFWLLLGAAFCFLALDELLQFHEKMGHKISQTSVGNPESFRNWNDVIVILYGVATLPVMLFFLPEVLGYKHLLKALVVAFLFYVAHTAIDSLAVGKSSPAMIAEESCKLFASGVFALSMFIGLLGVIREKIESGPPGIRE